MINLRSRLSANLGFLWKELPLSDRLIAASNSGFLHVELHSPYSEIDPQELATICKKYGLGITCINTPVSDGCESYFGLAAAPNEEKRFILDLQKSINYCRVSGCRAIHIMAGIVDICDYPTAEATIRKNLRVASEMAASYGIKILLEPLSQEAVPGYFYSTNDYILNLITDLNLENIGLMLDVFNTYMAAEDVCEIISQNKKKISHVQISSIPHRNEPNLNDGFLPDVIKTLDHVGYVGLIGCEYTPLESVEYGLNWINDFCEV